MLVAGSVFFINVQYVLRRKNVSSSQSLDKLSNIFISTYFCFFFKCNSVIYFIISFCFCVVTPIWHRQLCHSTMFTLCIRLKRMSNGLYLTQRCACVKIHNGVNTYVLLRNALQPSMEKSRKQSFIR